MKISRESVRHPSESLRCLHLKLKAFRGDLHRHRHLELTWIERGQGLRWVGDSVEPFFDGDLVLVGRDVVHTWATRGGPRSGGCEATVLQFPHDWVTRLALPELASIEPLLRQAGRGLQLQGATRSEVASIMVRARSVKGARRVGAVLDLLGALLEGQSDLRPLASRSAAVTEEAERAERAPTRIDAVLTWIETRLGEELRVEQAAEVAHVSPAAFSRFFRREVGKSFVDYVNDARCSWAALRLLAGREPVAQIAQDCGFTTLSNFGEQFRRRHGLAPRAFRRSHSD